MAKTGRKNKKYSPEFKLSVILDMRTHKLSYGETVRKHNLGNPKTGGARLMVQLWERIYLEEGAEGFMIERRGRASKGRPRKTPMPPEKQQDIIDELQQLRKRNEYLEMENEYLKKLNALIQSEEEKNNGKKPK